MVVYHLVQFSKSWVCCFGSDPQMGNSRVSLKVHKQLYRVAFPRSSLSAIFGSLGFPFLILWQKPGVLVTQLCCTLYTIVSFSSAKQRTERENCKMVCPTLLRHLLELERKVPHFQSFRYVWAPTDAVMLAPAGLYGYWVIRERRKEKETTERFLLLFLSVSNPPSCSTQN